MTTTPTTCHHTLMSPRIFTRFDAERVQQTVHDEHEQEDDEDVAVDSMIGSAVVEHSMKSPMKIASA